MIIKNCARLLLAMFAATIFLIASASVLDEQHLANVQTEYLMTFLAPLDPSSDIDSSLSISNVGSAGSWAKGPQIKGTFVPPGGDWSRVLPSGALRLDVRLTLKTDDGALVYISYNGIFKDSDRVRNRLEHGETLTPKDGGYWVIAPTFETSSPKYMWLNYVQAVGKMVEYKEGKDGYVKYDVFAIR
jgi:hypothetical protein